MHISFPHYSFVKRPDNGQVIDSDPSSPIVNCILDELPPLPVSDPHNLAFQCIIRNVPPAPIGNVGSLLFFTEAVPVDVDCTIGGTSSFDPRQHLEFISESHREVLGYDGSTFTYGLQFAAPTSDWDWYNEHGPYTIEVGQCFKLRFIIYSIDRDSGEPSYRQIAGCSNTMVRIAPEECYTSQISYRCRENSFDFDYTTVDTFYNKVELPFSLIEPKLVSDEKRYTRSDGQIMKLYERKEEEYIVDTALLPYNWLRKLEVALSHDIVLVHNPVQLTYDSDQGYISVIKSDAFEITYPKEHMLTRMGTARCKVRNTNPVHLINNNCK
jgi:uncharacterized protein YceK